MVYAAIYGIELRHALAGDDYALDEVLTILEEIMVNRARSRLVSFHCTDGEPDRTDTRDGTWLTRCSGGRNGEGPAAASGTGISRQVKPGGGSYRVRGQW